MRVVGKLKGYNKSKSMNGLGAWALEEEKEERGDVKGGVMRNLEAMHEQDLAHKDAIIANHVASIEEMASTIDAMDTMMGDMAAEIEEAKEFLLIAGGGET